MKNIVYEESPELIPIWMSDDLNTVSQHTHVKIGGKLKILYFLYLNCNDITPFLPCLANSQYWNLPDGTKLSDCPLPCTTHSTETRFLSEITSKTNTIDLAFAQTVQVTRTDFLPLSLSTFLSDVGGSMGLWLGLGVLQVIQLTVTCMQGRMTNWRCRKE